jgi:hypothetical protein
VTGPLPSRISHQASSRVGADARRVRPLRETGPARSPAASAHRPRRDGARCPSAQASGATRATPPHASSLTPPSRRCRRARLRRSRVRARAQARQAAPGTARRPARRLRSSALPHDVGGDSRPGDKRGRRTSDPAATSSRAVGRTIRNNAQRRRSSLGKLARPLNDAEKPSDGLSPADFPSQRQSPPG